MARNRGPGPIIHFMIVLIGVIAGYLFYSSATIDEVIESAQVAGLIPEIADSGTASDVTFFADMKFNLGILEKNIYRTLGPIGTTQVEPGVTGRTNPFAPF